MEEVKDNKENNNVNYNECIFVKKRTYQSRLIVDK